MSLYFAWCNVLNPPALLPLSDVEEEYVCETVTFQLVTPRPDLKDIGLHNLDLILCVDGSYTENKQGKYQAGDAVPTQYEFIEHRPFPQGNSAQQAELFALTRRACVIAQEKSVNIYTDSCCAFGVEHGYGMLWKQRGFPTSSGTPIQKRVLVEVLLSAILLPSKLAHH